MSSTNISPTIPPNPFKVIHYKAEGTSEFTNLLYIPSQRPFDILYKEYQMGLTLYVKRVKIIDHCDKLLAPYLRFLKGVVDSSDLPLNVSREILQNDRQIEVIKNSVTKKVLATLKELKEKESDNYLKFYGEFGRILKEGIHFDFSRRETIAELLLFPLHKIRGRQVERPGRVSRRHEGGAGGYLLYYRSIT